MFEFVKNEPKYWDFIRTLRSDERIQDSFVEQVKITPEQQDAYMQKHNDGYFICLAHLEGIDYQIPVGFVGVVDDDIRIAVIPEMHGKKVGSYMLKNIKELYPHAVAKVKKHNDKSIYLFISSGYEAYMLDDNFIYYRLPNVT